MLFFQGVGLDRGGRKKRAANKNANVGHIILCAVIRLKIDNGLKKKGVIVEISAMSFIYPIVLYFHDKVLIGR